MPSQNQAVNDNLVSQELNDVIAKRVNILERCFSKPLQLPSEDQIKLLKETKLESLSLEELGVLVAAGPKEVTDESINAWFKFVVALYLKACSHQEDASAKLIMSTLEDWGAELAVYTETLRLQAYHLLEQGNQILAKHNLSGKIAILDNLKRTDADNHIRVMFSCFLKNKKNKLELATELKDWLLRIQSYTSILDFSEEQSQIIAKRTSFFEACFKKQFDVIGNDKVSDICSKKSDVLASLEDSYIYVANYPVNVNQVNFDEWFKSVVDLYLKACLELNTQKSAINNRRLNDSVLERELAKLDASEANSLIKLMSNWGTDLALNFSVLPLEAYNSFNQLNGLFAKYKTNQKLDVLNNLKQNDMDEQINNVLTSYFKSTNTNFNGDFESWFKTIDTYTAILPLPALKVFNEYVALCSKIPKNRLSEPKFKELCNLAKMKVTKENYILFLSSLSVLALTLSADKGLQLELTTICTKFNAYLNQINQWTTRKANSESKKFVLKNEHLWKAEVQKIKVENDELNKSIASFKTKNSGGALSQMSVSVSQAQESPKENPWEMCFKEEMWKEAEFYCSKKLISKERLDFVKYLYFLSFDRRLNVSFYVVGLVIFELLNWPNNSVSAIINSVLSGLEVSESFGRALQGYLKNQQNLSEKEKYFEANQSQWFNLARRLYQNNGCNPLAFFDPLLKSGSTFGLGNCTDNDVKQLQSYGESLDCKKLKEITEPYAGLVFSDQEGFELQKKLEGTNADEAKQLSAKLVLRYGSFFQARYKSSISQSPIEGNKAEKKPPRAAFTKK